jgi:hypothetical protein
MGRPAPPFAPPAGGASPGSGGDKSWAKGTLLGVGAAEAAGGTGPVQPARAAGKPLPDFPEDDDEDGATTVAEVPRELLDASAGEDGDDAHFRDVFDNFIRTKQECNESTAGLTFDKFVHTLRKNRDQIVSRHGAKTVRFTVYVKDGKAALKATPVKD